MTECPDCGVELVANLSAARSPDRASPSAPYDPFAEQPDDTAADDTARVDAAPDDGGPAGASTGTGPDQLEYDLGLWSVEQREMLDRLLTGSVGSERATIPVAYVWQGTTLVIPSGSAPLVDGLLAQVEADVDLALDPDADKVAYDCAGLPDDQLESLLEALAREAIPFALSDDEELFVLEDDEARVDAIFDVVVDPDALDAEDDGGEGLVAPEVLGEIFVAADRLQKDARDPEGVIGLMDGLETIHEVQLPYGFAPEVWSSIIDEIAGVSALIHDDDSTDDVIEEAATALRRRLRGYV